MQNSESPRPRRDGPDPDLVILGGGIAGLWTLNLAVQAGHDAILLERDRLGGGQSIRSQGIIHGGMKYALQGVLTTASSAVGEMPARWRACLDGSGQIDLRGAKILSEAHYLWSKRTLGARVAGFFAAHALRERISPVPFHERPGVLRNTRFQGDVYRLNEIVLDVGSLLERLAGPVAHRIFRAEPEGYRSAGRATSKAAHGEPATSREGRAGEGGGAARYRIGTRDGALTALTFPEHGLTLRPGHLVICCGEGYEALAGQLNLNSPRMQRRPLHMVMVKFPRGVELPFYAHCLSGGPRPLVTITTHYARDHSTIWYLGGELAESGTGRDEGEQIKKARSTLQGLLPWVDLAGTRWAALRVDRAEPGQSTLTLPDSAFVEERANLMIAWPTKLALAPDLAEKILARLPTAGEGAGKSTGAMARPELAVLPRPAIAEPPWEEAFADA